MPDPGKHLDDEEAWRIYELIETLHDFLHQPENYQDARSVERWLQGGVYEELKRIYYDVIGPWFPIDERTGEVSSPPGIQKRFQK